MLVARGVADLEPTSATTRAEYVDRVCAGGFPLALRRPAGPARDRWFDDYLKQSLERDAIELARIRQRQLLRELLGRLGGRTGQVLNLSAASEGLGVSRTTAEEHTRLLEDLFLIERLPAWGKTLRARTVASPKVHVIDSGVAARLLRVSPTKLAGLDPTTLTEFGNLLETFVIGELRKHAAWLDERVSSRDFKGLRTLRGALGKRFIAGVAFTTGFRSCTHDDRLHVMPVDRLWRPVPSWGRH